MGHTCDTVEDEYGDSETESHVLSLRAPRRHHAGECRSQVWQQPEDSALRICTDSCCVDPEARQRLARHGGDD